MDIHIAAQLLGVAAHEVSAVEHTAEGWIAVHEDMASHVTTRRLIPGADDAPPGGADDETPAAEEPGAAPGRKPRNRKAAGDDGTGA